MKAVPLGPSLSLVFLSLACSQTSPTSPQAPPTKPSGSAQSASTAVLPGRGTARTIAPRRSPPVGALGNWGGNHLLMTITEIGGRLEYDCAHGSIDQPFVVDAAGYFDLLGTHVREHGGPVSDKEQPDAHPARYTGWTDGKTMTLTVWLTDSTQAIGTFTLRLGDLPKIVHCL